MNLVDPVQKRKPLIITNKLHERSALQTTSTNQLLQKRLDFVVHENGGGIGASKEALKDFQKHANTFNIMIKDGVSLAIQQLAISSA